MHVCVRWIANEGDQPTKKHAFKKTCVDAREKKTRPDTRLPQSRAGVQGLYLRSLDHVGRSSDAMDHGPWTASKDRTQSAVPDALLGVISCRGGVKAMQRPLKADVL